MVEHDVFSAKKIHFSRGLQQDKRKDMSVLVTAISRHICYLLNIEGKFCFSLPEDLTVKDYFCIFMTVPCLDFRREIQETTARSCACARHETAHLRGLNHLSKWYMIFKRSISS